MSSTTSAPSTNTSTSDLATPFEVLTATGRLDFDGWEPLRLSLVGEYAKNLAFDQDDINAVAVNNRGPNGEDGALGAFDGSDTAWYLNLVAGHPALDQRGHWQRFRRLPLDRVATPSSTVSTTRTSEAAEPMSKDSPSDLTTPSHHASASAPNGSAPTKSPVPPSPATS